MSNYKPLEVVSSIDAVRRPVREILSLPFIVEFRAIFIATLEQHGCSVRIEESCWRIVFPEGTFKNEILPRIGSERYLITFPDGYIIGETISRISGQECLWLPIEDIPPKLQKKHHGLIKRMLQL